MMTTDEVENEENAETSVRAAVLGKGDGNEKTEREMDRSVAESPARYDIGTPGRGSGMEDEVGIEDGPVRPTDQRFTTPEQNPATKRDVEDEDDTMGEHNKRRRVTGDDSMDSTGKMNEDYKRILMAAISGVDITEVYSPIRVAAVASKFGLAPGASFDLTNGWVQNRWQGRVRRRKKEKNTAEEERRRQRRRRRHCSPGH